MVLLLIIDAPEVRTAFALAEIQTVETRDAIGGPQTVQELLIGEGVNLSAPDLQGRLF